MFRHNKSFVIVQIECTDVCEETIALQFLAIRGEVDIVRRCLECFINKYNTIDFECFVFFECTDAFEQGISKMLFHHFMKNCPVHGGDEWRFKADRYGAGEDYMYLVYPKLLQKKQVEFLCA